MVDKVQTRINNLNKHIEEHKHIMQALGLEEDKDLYFHIKQRKRNVYAALTYKSLELYLIRVGEEATHINKYITTQNRPKKVLYHRLNEYKDLRNRLAHNTSIKNDKAIITALRDIERNLQYNLVEFQAKGYVE